MNIVFDFAGVLFDWSPVALVREVLPDRHDEAAALVEAIFQNYGADWADFDRGTVEPGALAERIAARTGLRADEARAVIDAVPRALRPMAGSVDLVRRLHASGRPLHFLSNMPEPYARHLEAAHDFLALFRDGVFSSRVGLIKPERAIFDHARDRFRIEPARTLFIDDLLPNVEAARAAGWRALHFENPAQCESALVRLGFL